jgi:hypothetical protein
LDRIIEAFKTGDAGGIQAACNGIVRSWRDIDIIPLLALKEHLSKLGLEQRAAHLTEALISVAEKRPDPFIRIAEDSESPLWRPAVEVLSMGGEPALFGILAEQLKTCRKRSLPDMITALGRYGDRAAPGLAAFLKSDDDAIFYETVLALRDAGQEGEERLKGALENYRKTGSERAAVIEAALA